MPFLVVCCIGSSEFPKGTKQHSSCSRSVAFVVASCKCDCCTVAEICVTNLLKFYLLMTTRKGSAWGGKNGRTSKPEISVSWQCVTIVSHGSLCTLSSRNCASARDLVWFGLLYCRYLRSACALQNKTKRFHVSPFVLFLCICRLYVSAVFLVLFFPPFLSGWHHADS